MITPMFPTFQNTLGHDLIFVGSLQVDLGRPAEAMKSFRQSLVVYERLVRDHPTVAEYQANQSGAQHSIGWLLTGLGRPAEALPWLQRALPAKERLARKPHRHRLPGSARTIPCGDRRHPAPAGPIARGPGRAATGAGDPRAVRAAHNAVGAYQSEAATCHIQIGSLLNQMNRHAESRREYQTAVDLFARIPTPLLPDLYNLGCAHARLAALSNPAGRAHARRGVAHARPRRFGDGDASSSGGGRLQERLQPARGPRP